MNRLSAIIPLMLLPGARLCYSQIPSAPEPALPVAADVQQGVQALRAGHFAEAEQILRAAAAASPGNAAASLQLGMVELRLGKPSEAVRALKKTLDSSPDEPGVRLFLGIAYAQMHQLENAEAVLLEEIAREPKRAEAQMWLGIVELQAGRPENATAPLDAAAQLSPEDLDILEYRGEAHSEVAHDSYARMARLAPDSWHVHKVQGQLYAMDERHSEAIAEFLKAIHSSPGNADLYEELGTEYRKSGQLDLAQEAFRRELELSPDNPVAMYSLASMDIERSQTEEGLMLMRKVIPEAPNAAGAYYYVGRAQAKAGKLPASAEALERALTLHPDAELMQRIDYELSHVYRRMGRLNEAEQKIQEYQRMRAQMATRSAAAHAETAAAQ